MQIVSFQSYSLGELIRGLGKGVRTLLQRELQLARTEICEEVTHLARNSAWVAAGGLLALMGGAAFIFGLCWLVAWAFVQAGLQPLFAVFLGSAGIGLLVTGIGASAFFWGARRLTRQSIKPEQTIKAAKQILSGGKMAHPISSPGRQASPAVAKVQSGVQEAEEELETEFNELVSRFSLHHLNAGFKHSIQRRPYSASLAAALAGLAGALLLGRKAHSG